MFKIAQSKNLGKRSNINMAEWWPPPPGFLTFSVRPPYTSTTVTGKVTSQNSPNLMQFSHDSKATFPEDVGILHQQKGKSWPEWIGRSWVDVAWKIIKNTVAPQQRSTSAIFVAQRNGRCWNLQVKLFFCWSHETETGNNPFCQWGWICSIFWGGKNLFASKTVFETMRRQRRLSTLVLALDQVEEMSHLGAKSFVTSWKLSQIRHEFWIPSRKPMCKMMKFWHALVWLFLIMLKWRKVCLGKWGERRPKNQPWSPFMSSFEIWTDVGGIKALLVIVVLKALIQEISNRTHGPRTPQPERSHSSFDGSYWVLSIFPPHILEEILILQFCYISILIFRDVWLAWYEHLFQTFIILNFWKCIVLKLSMKNPVPADLSLPNMPPFQTSPITSPPSRCPGRSKLTDRDFIKISPSVAAIILRSGSAHHRWEAWSFWDRDLFRRRIMIHRFHRIHVCYIYLQLVIPCMLYIPTVPWLLWVI